MIRPELQELRSELGELRLLKFLTDVDLRPQLVALDHLISTQSPPDLVDAFGRAQRRGHPGASSPPPAPPSSMLGVGVFDVRMATDAAYFCGACPSPPISMLFVAPRGAVLRCDMLTLVLSLSLSIPRLNIEIGGPGGGKLVMCSSPLVLAQAVGRSTL